MSDYSSNSQDYERENKADYGLPKGARNDDSVPRPNYRTKRRPTGHSGIHRRRQKRWSW